MNKMISFGGLLISFAFLAFSGVFLFIGSMIGAGLEEALFRLVAFLPWFRSALSLFEFVGFWPIIFINLCFSALAFFGVRQRQNRVALVIVSLPSVFFFLKLASLLIEYIFPKYIARLFLSGASFGGVTLTSTLFNVGN